MDTPKHRVIILGGGISGLLAAWHLQRRGHEVEVWEAASTVGGWAQTLSWPGPKGERGFLERGPQGLLMGRDSALKRLTDDLHLDLHSPMARGPRWLGKEGSRHPSPTTLAGLLRAPGLRLGERLRLLVEPLIPACSDTDETLQAFFARRLGAGFAREWLPALVAGVLAAPPEHLGLAALPRLKRLEAQGGLLIGGFRTGPTHTLIPISGTGALVNALAEQLGSVRMNYRAHELEPLPQGRWRVQGNGHSSDAEAVVLALPTLAATTLLRSVAPPSANELAGIPCLDLQVWHSRHALVPGWERGFGLLLHPPEGRGLLGVVAIATDDPRGIPGLLQVRTYLGGAYPVDPALADWPGVLQELRRWLPELSDPVQVRQEACPGAFPQLEPGHDLRVRRLLEGFPPGLHWVGAARFGPGIADLAEGIETWVQTTSL